MNMFQITSFAIACAITISGAAAQGVSGAPSDARVYFVNVADGDTVASPVTVVFGLSGMGIAPAGHEIDNTGHHHLLINRQAWGDRMRSELAQGHLNLSETTMTNLLPCSQLRGVTGEKAHRDREAFVEKLRANVVRIVSEDFI